MPRCLFGRPARGEADCSQQCLQPHQGGWDCSVSAPASKAPRIVALDHSPIAKMRAGAATTTSIPALRGWVSEINCMEGSAQTQLMDFSFPRAPFRSCRRSARLYLCGEAALIHFLHDLCSLACSRSTPPGRGAQELVASISQAREVSPWSKITAAKKLPLQVREFVYFCCLLSSN